jgi:hypothetical protein
MNPQHDKGIGSQNQQRRMNNASQRQQQAVNQLAKRRHAALVQHLVPHQQQPEKKKFGDTERK